MHDWNILHNTSINLYKRSMKTEHKVKTTCEWLVNAHLENHSRQQSEQLCICPITILHHTSHEHHTTSGSLVDDCFEISQDTVLILIYNLWLQLDKGFYTQIVTNSSIFTQPTNTTIDNNSRMVSLMTATPPRITMKHAAEGCIIQQISQTLHIIINI